VAGTVSTAKGYILKNKNNWKPNKYVPFRGKWRASRDPQQVAVGSRLVADITAEWYASLLPEYARGKLLDLGCGHVPLFGMYEPYIADNLCVDWGGSFHQNTYLDLEHDLTQTLPFDEGVFDTVILSDVLEHIAEPARLWGEMARVLKPGGRLILNVPFFYCLHELPHDYYRYTRFALQRFAEQAGLKVLLLEASGGSVEVWADMFAKHLQFVPLIGRGVAAFVQWGASLLRKTRLGRRLGQTTAQAFPLGYFMVAEK
jgi:SAM-dependent methyltransferase